MMQWLNFLLVAAGGGLFKGFGLWVLSRRGKRLIYPSVMYSTIMCLYLGFREPSGNMSGPLLDILCSLRLFNLSITGREASQSLEC